ncbi:MAG: hypothetical protein WCJ59_01400 [bacterium]
MNYASLMAAASASQFFIGVYNVLSDDASHFRTAGFFACGVWCAIIALLLGLKHVIKEMKGL